MAILGAFLYSVPFMEVEAPKSYDTNTKSYIQLLGISEEIQYVLKTQIFLYANILNSWGFYIQRAELIKAFQASEAVKNLLHAERIRQKQQNESRSWPKLAKLTGAARTPEGDKGDSCLCKRCNECRTIIDKCVICLADIKKLKWECEKCFHQAHWTSAENGCKGIKDWFSNGRTHCPFWNCDCECRPL